jgi:hypothetical protein
LPISTPGGRPVRLAVAFLLAAAPALAQPSREGTVRVTMDDAQLARAVQNPLANMISLPVQNDANPGYGPDGHVQNVLNIQPVVPVALNEDWNVIVRPVLPVTWQPPQAPGAGSSFGLGATQTQFLLTPSRAAHHMVWGAGAVVQVPTTTDPALGSRLWGAGPGVIALTMRGPWVLGGVVNNVWSLGDNPRSRYSTLTLQPLSSYNFPQWPGTFLSFSPIITANWEARRGDVWTVPVGLALGQIFHLGQQPLNAQLGAYYNVVRPENGPTWQIRFQVALLFPK